MLQNTKEVSIRFKDGEKEAELNLVEVSPEHQLALIDGVFKFLNIDVSFKEMAEVSLQTRKAYLDFFNKTNVTDFTETNEVIEEIEEIEETKEEPTISIELKENAKDEKNWDIQSLEEIKPHWYTGIMVKKGVEHFKAYYKCPSCSKKATVYVKKTDRNCRCYDCGTMMMLRPATDEELGRDSFGNFFHAGNHYPISVDQ
jgi:ribosomal protein S27E